jgi:branched-chain amino acid aminotransferase
MAAVRLWELDLQSPSYSPRFLREVSHTSLDGLTLELPEGAYTTLRTYRQSYALDLEMHFRRIEESLARAGVPLTLPRSELRKALRGILVNAGTEGDQRVRMLVPLQPKPAVCYILVEPLKVPESQMYQEGVWAVTRFMHRERPEAKLSAFILQTASIRQTLLLSDPHVNEVLMVDEDGRILEGFSSNFFAIQNGVLRTAGKGVLPGITRAFVLAEAQRAGYPTIFRAITIDELKDIDEAFITSASRGVLPVVRIDDQWIGSGKPGPITKTLGCLFERRVEQEIMPI